eukprot:5706040-Prymnesium_polylepis.1
MPGCRVDRGWRVDDVASPRSPPATPQCALVAPAGTPSALPSAASALPRAPTSSRLPATAQWGQ